MSATSKGERTQNHLPIKGVEIKLPFDQEVQNNITINFSACEDLDN